MPNNTLEKWEEKTLGDILSLEYGKSLDKSERSENGIYNAYGANGVKDKTDKFLYNKKSIIVGRKGSAGELNYTEEKFWALDVCYYVIFDEQRYDIKFLYNLLKLQNLPSLAKGVKPGINRNDVYALKVKIPNFKEQQRIVGLLDEAFENIEKAKQNTLQNLNNAKELFESYLKKYFEIGNSSWNKYKLSEITTKIGSGATPLGGKKAYIDSGISLIRSMNVYDREFIYEGLAHINEEQAKQLNVVTIQEKDVLLNITGASVARCCVVPSDIIPARVNQHVSIIRPKQDIVLSRFLCYLLTSNYYKNKLLKDGEEGGATRQALTKMGLEQFEVYIPNTLVEQQKIVEQLDELQEQTKNLEQIYTQKLQDLDELKQSILQKAFNGEL